MDFLSMYLSEKGLLLTEEGTECIMNWPCLQKPKNVLVFLGLIQYYVQFLPSFSKLCASLNKAKAKKKLL